MEKISLLIAPALILIPVFQDYPHGGTLFIALVALVLRSQKPPL